MCSLFLNLSNLLRSAPFGSSKVSWCRPCCFQCRCTYFLWETSHPTHSSSTSSSSINISMSFLLSLCLCMPGVMLLLPSSLKVFEDNRKSINKPPPIVESMQPSQSWQIHYLQLLHSCCCLQLQFNFWFCFFHCCLLRPCCSC